MEEIDIVIIGGGIAGLATSLALHRKGIESVVLERSEVLRSTGAGIGVLPNGWRALDQLGVADKLRQNALPIHRMQTVVIKNGKQKEFVSPAFFGEARCVRRIDLVQALVDDLPHGTVRFGYQIVSVNLDKTTSFSVLELSNGTKIKAKVLIGCDGANSIVADFLQLSPKKLFASRTVRGFTSYPNGHGFEPELIRIKIGNALCGRLPITDKLVYWFAVLQQYPKDSDITKDQEAIAKLTLGSINEFSEEWKDMVKNCDISSLSITHLRYRAPWHILTGTFRRATVTVAGDAMHVMGPFLGQGGSAALEDAVILARCLARKSGQDRIKGCSMKKIGEAMDEYVKERRMRLVGLSTQTYLTGLMLQTPSQVVRLMLVVLLGILFGNQIRHAQYDCGRL